MKNKEIISFYEEMGPISMTIWAGKLVRSYFITSIFYWFILTLTVDILFIYTESWKEIFNIKSVLLRSENFGVMILIILIFISNSYTLYGFFKCFWLYFKTPKNRFFEELPNMCQ